MTDVRVDPYTGMVVDEFGNVVQDVALQQGALIAESFVDKQRLGNTGIVPPKPVAAPTPASLLAAMPQWVLILGVGLAAWYFLRKKR